MITNGYLLNSRNIEKLKDWKIQLLQTTLDGPPNIHDLRRPTVTKKPSYDKIVDNISNLIKQEAHPSITIRVNTDERNKEHLYELVEDLRNKGVLERISLYLAPVTRTTKACGDIGEYIIGQKEFLDLEITFLKKIIGENIIVTVPYPQRSAPQCMAVSPDSLVIGPDGTLWPCWDVTGRYEEAIGNIKSGYKINNTFLKWSLWDPFSDEECLSCKIFPVCMGGCPAKRVPLNKKHFTAVFQKKCSTWRYGAEEYLKLIAKLHYRKEKSKNNSSKP